MEKVMCPLCKEVVEIDQDGTCMECTEPLAFPAISKAGEKAKLGKIVSEMPEIVYLDKNDNPRKSTKDEQALFGNLEA